MTKRYLTLIRYALVTALVAGMLAPAQAEAHDVFLPAGAVIPVRFTTTVSSATSRPGDAVLAVVRQDVFHRGRVVVPEGSEVRGRVVAARRSGKVKGRAYLAVDFDRVTVRGRTYRIATPAISATARGTVKRDAALVGGGAGAGALVGALVDGGSGAKKGALIGGVAGTGAVLTTRGREVTFPAGARYRLRLSHACTAAR